MRLKSPKQREQRNSQGQEKRTGKEARKGQRAEVRAEAKRGQISKRQHYNQQDRVPSHGQEVRLNPARVLVSLIPHKA